MSHSGDDRGLAGIDGAGHSLVVEGPQILHGAAAPAGDDDVTDLPFIRVPDGSGDLRRSLRALHPDGQQDDFRNGIPAAQNADHVVDRRARRGSHNGDLLRISGQRLFVGGVKQPLGVQLGLQLLKSHRQVAHALRGHGIAVELIGTVTGKHGDTARHHYLHAVFRPEPEAHGAALEHDAADGALLVLQGEIVVPGGVHFVVGKFAPDADVLEHGLVVQQELHQFIDFGNAEDMLFHERLLC